MLYSLGSQASVVDMNHAFHLYYNVVCGSSFRRSQPDFEGFLRALQFPPSAKLTPSLIQYARARNNGRSTDNVRTDCGFDWSNVRLAGHVDRSEFSRIENEINLRFLLFSWFSCHLSSRCALRNFGMKSW